MDIQVFQNKYNELKTYKDAENLINEMSIEQMKELVEAMETVHAYTGLDMRQYAFMLEIRTKLSRC